MIHSMVAALPTYAREQRILIEQLVVEAARLGRKIFALFLGFKFNR